jgi:hypothetical protein
MSVGTPAGVDVDVTTPVPIVPSTGVPLFTVRRNLFRVNVAVTFLAWSIVTTQAPDPVQSPDQPVNVEERGWGVGVRVTKVDGA